MRKKWPYPYIIIATANRHKVKQFSDLLQPFFPLEVKGLQHFSQYPTVVEDQNSFAGNARKKAEEIAHWIQGPVLSDDSGLVVPALGEAPGIYSARYAGEQATDAENNEKLYWEIQSVPEHQRQAYYVCAMALAVPGKKTLIVQAECHGMITTSSRGDQGFGYDPMFYLPQEGQTMAELSPEKRYQISHRAKATRLMVQRLQTDYDWSELHV